jgi:hypothetical protein
MSAHVMSRPASRCIPVVRAKSGPTALVLRFIEGFTSTPGVRMTPLLTHPEKSRSRAALADSAGIAPRRWIKSEYSVTSRSPRSRSATRPR